MFKKYGKPLETEVEKSVLLMKEEGLSEERILERLNFRERLCARRIFLKGERFLG